MSQENLTFTFFSTSVVHFSPKTAHAQWAALPQHPPVLCVLSSHLTLTTEVTGVWPLHLVGTEPGQDADLSPSPAALNCFIKPLWDQIFLGTDWTGEDVCFSCCCGCGWHPQRCGSTGTDGLHLPAGGGPWLLSTMITPNAGTKHIYWTQEDEQQEHCVKGFCAFPLISFLTYFLLPGSSDHMYRTPTPGEQFSIFFSSSSVWRQSLLTARHPHPVQQCPLGFPQHSPSRIGGSRRDAWATMSLVRWGTAIAHVVRMANQDREPPSAQQPFWDI